MSSRPPPLRASDQPPAYRMVNRVYGNSLRPIVIVIGCVTAIWTLVWAIPNFQDISPDKDLGYPKLATLAIVLGSIYIGACAIELLGVAAAAIQSLVMIRAYTLLSVVAALAVIGAALMRVINDLIAECTSVAQGDTVTFRFGIWGPVVKDTLSPADAANFCKDAWNHDSLSEILYLIFEIIFATFFTLIAFAYYQQVLDPTSAANVSHSPTHELGTYPEHYHPPYDAPLYAPSYAPPPGPPPADMGYGVGMGVGAGDDTKPPGYSGASAGAEHYGEKDDPFADFDGPSIPRPEPGQHRGDDGLA
ncbi:hypothetical protein A0H81_03345 [Grifola frondosa]|uniref:Uncharacterized protein n=1 Tax=Grifola frondosa TaxID=5627 RepID=A0A1C7MIM7_GRIFR|nr:hypothetical protein A0H81_03345 [Grifola frondosa]